ncbi:MAG: hypothetical protein RBJ76_09365 [Stenomitos frigidus ULC029]
METTAFNVLVLITFGLLVIISGGVGYLTFAEWRDRRRREQDLRGDRPVPRTVDKASRGTDKSARRNDKAPRSSGKVKK